MQISQRMRSMAHYGSSIPYRQWHNHSTARPLLSPNTSAQAMTSPTTTATDGTSAFAIPKPRPPASNRQFAYGKWLFAAPLHNEAPHYLYYSLRLKKTTPHRENDNPQKTGQHRPYGLNVAPFLGVFSIRLGFFSPTRTKKIPKDSSNSLDFSHHLH